MALTGRFVLLLLLGVVPVVLRPDLDTVWLWLLVVTALGVLDWALSPRITSLAFARPPVGQVRQGYPTTTTLQVTNLGRRRIRAWVRDAWQPSAGATGNRHRISLAPQKSQHWSPTCVRSAGATCAPSA